MCSVHVIIYSKDEDKLKLQREYRAIRARCVDDDTVVTPKVKMAIILSLKGVRTVMSFKTSGRIPLGAFSLEVDGLSDLAWSEHQTASMTEPQELAGSG